MKVKTKTKEELKIETASVYYNLCSMCKNALDCRYIKSQESSILFCDEFDGYKEKIPKIEFIKQVTKVPEKNNPSNLIGLCRNCEIRETCTYPKPESGVWRCEEYR